MTWTLLVFLLFPAIAAWIGPGDWSRRLLVYAFTFGAMVLIAITIGGIYGELAGICVGAALTMANLELR